MRARILVGTMSGTAEMVAEEVGDALEADGQSIEILPMDDLDSSVFEGEADVFLVCTSTYGQGDVPDNARRFFESLTRRRPDLSAIRYGVIGLGDSTYADTFCNGGRQFDDLLSDLGATRIGERLEHNASSDEVPEEMAVDWARDWIAEVRSALEAAL